VLAPLIPGKAFPVSAGLLAISRCVIEIVDLSKRGGERLRSSARSWVAKQKANFSWQNQKKRNLDS
jgi:hypothetical protein